MSTCFSHLSLAGVSAFFDAFDESFLSKLVEDSLDGGPADAWVAFFNVGESSSVSWYIFSIIGFLWRRNGSERVGSVSCCF